MFPAWQIAVVLLSLLPFSAIANERLQTFGQWEAHIMVLPTTLLSPEIAASHGITRANNTAFANVAILDSDAGTLTGVRSQLNGKVKNLTGQTRNLQFQEVVEGNAIYYVAEFRYTHRERLRFQVDFAPEPDTRSYTLEFAQEIYREDRP